MIESKGLHIGYSDSILKVQDLQLKTGLHILIGKNGSGKSTFLKTITGQLAPIEGNISLNDHDIGSIELTKIPTIISFVGSQFPIVDFMRVFEFIELARSPYTNYFGRISQKDHQISMEALQILGIENLKYRFTSQLSDGEKQLVSIAKAISQETSIIALDEPTAFLDYSNKKLVLDKLIKLSQEFDKCIILSSHDIDLSIEANCPFLVINDNKKELQIHDSSITKQEIISIAF